MATLPASAVRHRAISLRIRSGCLRNKAPRVNDGHCHSAGTSALLVQTSTRRSCSSSTSPTRSNGSSASSEQNVDSATIKRSIASLADLAKRNVQRWTRELPLQVTATTSAWFSRPSKVSRQRHSSLTSSAKLPASPSSKPAKTDSDVTVSKSSLDARTRYLLSSIVTARCNHSKHRSVEEFCKFLRQYPVAQSLAAKSGAVRSLLLTQQSTADPLVQEGIREALVLVGFCEPPSGWGVRILSIDGGGLRGIMALEIFKQLEALTGNPVHKMFDYICGVSTGAVLAILLGSLKSTVFKCEDLYRKIGSEIFTQNRIVGTGKLVLSHAFYDTDNWTKLLRTNIGESLLLETARDRACPKIAAISTVVNRPRLQPYLFRNYDYPRRVRSTYEGTTTARLWEAIRASAAAPGYFEEFKLGDDVHQDGGVLVNNPAALALHECKLLWPNEALQCVVSIGSGRYEPQHVDDPSTYTGLKNKLLKIVDSATDTEAVHTILHDLLPPTTYFRFNPYLSENFTLDETREDKMSQMQEDAKMYLRRNESKLRSAAALLMEPRSRYQVARDYIVRKTTTVLG